MTKVGVIGLKGSWSSESLSGELTSRGANGSLIEVQEISLDMNTMNFQHPTIDLSHFDAWIIKKLGREYSPDLLEQLFMLQLWERQGMKFFSSPTALLGIISRLNCTVKLREKEIPMPPTLITQDAVAAHNWLAIHQEAIVKPLYSTKARGMQVLAYGDHSFDEIKKIQETLGILYLQAKCDLKDRDYGFVFMNNQFLGAYARVGDGSTWNTTTVNGGKYQTFEPSQELIDLAHNAQEGLGLTFTTVDVAITDDGPIIFEVSAFGGYRGLYEAAGVNASAQLVDHVLESLK